MAPTSNLPRKSLNYIAYLMETKSRLNMREVCKLVKPIVDSLFNARNPKIDMISIVSNEIEDDEVNITYVFRNKINLDMWKVCAISALIYLGISEDTIYTTRFERYLLSMNLQVEMVDSFLKKLKPHIHNSTIRILHIENENIDIVCTWLDSVEDSIIHAFHLENIDLWNANLEYLLTFIHKVHAKSVDISPYVHLSKEFLGFLSHVAEFVDKLNIKKDRGNLGSFSRFPLSIIKTIMSKRCNDFSLIHSSTILSVDDVEKLVQIFHNIGKKIKFRFNSNLEAQITQMGEFIVDATRNQGSTTVIRHIDWHD